jgi:hypothetical protein
MLICRHGAVPWPAYWNSRAGEYKTRIPFQEPSADGEEMILGSSQAYIYRCPRIHIQVPANTHTGASEYIYKVPANKGSTPRTLRS